MPRLAHPKIKEKGPQVPQTALFLDECLLFCLRVIAEAAIPSELWILAKLALMLLPVVCLDGTKGNTRLRADENLLEKAVQAGSLEGP